VQVIATAGHVDHGKSALVRALTGMEPDRWADEQRRGLTIDLGFAWLTLPGGQRLAFVDVPGHERFVPNMLAGVGPVPAVLFVVAADGGWMPQSAEHLAAIDALGIRHGLLAVTRADLADPGPALRQARAEIGRTSLGHVPAVPVSALTGQGLPQLREALATLAAGLPRPDPAAPVRLWVDRVFSITGSGTVVTGTLPAGTLRVGDELILTPSDTAVRIRAIESLKSKTTELSGVARVALNLRGTPASRLGRGMALVQPGGWTLTDQVDVRLAAAGPANPPEMDPLRTDLPGTGPTGAVPPGADLPGTDPPGAGLPRDGLPRDGLLRTDPPLVDPRKTGLQGTAPRPASQEGTRPRKTGLRGTNQQGTRPRGTDAPGAGPGEARRLPREVTVHIGSARTTARVRPFGGPFARLHLREPVPLHVGDRLLLRDPGAAGPSWAGIAGATVLDVSPPPAPRRGAATAVHRELASWSVPPATADLLARHGLLPEAAVRAMGLWLPALEPGAGGAGPGTAPPGGRRPVRAAGWVADPAHWAALRTRLGQAVARHAASDPLAIGLPLEAARVALHLPDRKLVEALATMPTSSDSAAEPSQSAEPLRSADPAQSAEPANIPEAASTPEPADTPQPASTTEPPAAIEPPAATDPPATFESSDTSELPAIPKPPVISEPSIAPEPTATPERPATPEVAGSAEAGGPARGPGPRLILRDGYLSLGQPAGPDTAPQDALPGPVSRAVQVLRADLATAPFHAPEAGRLRELGLDRKMLAAAERAGLLLRVSPEIVLAPDADAAAAEVLARLPQPFTTAQARQALGTTRRVAIPLLEYLDRRAVTQRLPDDRRMVRPGQRMTRPGRGTGPGQTPPGAVPGTGRPGPVQ